MTKPPAQSGGFSPDGIRFFEDLEDDNTREFWQAHKDTFEQEVREPLASLVESMPDSYQPFRMFRMNRDVRFTHDKAPYKTQHSAVHESAGTDHYLQLSAQGLMVGAGIYWMQADQLQRYRAAVDDARRGPALERTLRRLTEQSIDVNVVGLPALKTAPRGYPRDHSRIDLLRRKGVVGHRALDGPDLADARALHEFVVTTFESCGPLVTWLRNNVGPPHG